MQLYPPATVIQSSRALTGPLISYIQPGSTRVCGMSVFVKRFKPVFSGHVLGLSNNISGSQFKDHGACLWIALTGLFWHKQPQLCDLICLYVVIGDQYGLPLSLSISSIAHCIILTKPVAQPGNLTIVILSERKACICKDGSIRFLWGFTVYLLSFFPRKPSQNNGHFW